MKAAVVNVGLDQPPVTIQDVQPGPVPAGWATVRLRAAALNRLDAMMLANRATEAPGAVYGSDGAGVVAELGPGVPTRSRDGLSVGTDVVISPSMFWGDDPTAPGERYEILGSPTRGTHAEFVTVPVENLFPKPEHLDWAEAAALPMAGVTAWRALVTRGRLKSSDTVVVGAGSSGVGSMAIQIAAAVGARVLAVTSSDDKAAQARALGAHATVDRTSAGPEGLAKQIVDASEGGATLALDPTGALWQTFVDALRPGGRLVVVGKMAADQAQLRVQSVYWKQVDILGSTMGSPRDFADLLAHLQQHRWAPLIDSTYSLDDIAAAYARLDHPDRVGKVVLDLSSRPTS